MGAASRLLVLVDPLLALVGRFGVALSTFFRELLVFVLLHLGCQRFVADTDQTFVRSPIDNQDLIGPYALIVGETLLVFMQRLGIPITIVNSKRFGDDRCDIGFAARAERGRSAHGHQPSK